MSTPVPSFNPPVCPPPGTGGGGGGEAANPVSTLVLCDDNGPFIRTFEYVIGSNTVVTDTTLTGAPYQTTGTVGVCAGGGGTPVAQDQALRTVRLADGDPGVALRTPTGDLMYLNVLTGAEVQSSDVMADRPDPTYASVFLVDDTADWTAAMIPAGSLLSLTLVVTLGTVLVDMNNNRPPVLATSGVSLSWSSVNGGHLDGPTRIYSAGLAGDANAIVSTTSYAPSMAP